jgi:hypothetical protein
LHHASSFNESGLTGFAIPSLVPVVIAFVKHLERDVEQADGSKFLDMVVTFTFN